MTAKLCQTGALIFRDVRTLKHIVYASAQMRCILLCGRVETRNKDCGIEFRDSFELGRADKKLKAEVLETEPENGEFPTNLAGFGYGFSNGQLRNIVSGEPFEFTAKDGDMYYNQKRYEALGEVITDHVYNLLMTECKLEKYRIPLGKTDSEPSTFIFHSSNAFTADKLVLFIHGSGVVRAGQWARKLIINDCLNSGTQIPFIKKALIESYGVFVLNTNDNFIKRNGVTVDIRGSESPEEHAIYIWDKVISKCSAKHVAIIAHSYGGIVTINMCQTFSEKCKQKVFAIAFTDSVHSLAHQLVSDDMSEWFIDVTRNWVSSDEPLDTPVSRCRADEIPCVSAGTTSHEMTSWSSFESIFKFLDERYQKVVVNRRNEL